eukprot:scaffold226771_cov29-Tisochrysis_lutea.AAC.1
MACHREYKRIVLDVGSSISMFACNTTTIAVASVSLHHFGGRLGFILDNAPKVSRKCACETRAAHKAWLVCAPTQAARSAQSPSPTYAKAFNHHQPTHGKAFNRQHPHRWKIVQSPSAYTWPIHTSTWEGNYTGRGW